MRVALIHTPLTSPTGGERQVLMLAIELQKLGHDVQLYTNEVRPGDCFPELISRVDVKVIRNDRHRRFDDIFRMADIGKAVAKERFDVINNHNFPTEWAVFFAKMSRKTPAVWMCNEPPYWMYVPEERRKIKLYNYPAYVYFDRLSVRSIDRIVVLSEMMGDAVRATYNRGFDVIHSGVDVDQFTGVSGNAFRQKHGIGEAFMLLQVGSLASYKRPEDSVKALVILLKRGRDAKLVFAGPDVEETRGRLTRLMNAENITDRVLFLGAIPDSELRQAYAACDAFLFPSSQSWSLVATEAMASGKPVIVSDRCGVAEIVENRINGFVAGHGDYSQIADYVEALFLDKHLRDQVSKNARATVQNDLTWRKYAENMEAVYSKAIAGQRI